MYCTLADLFNPSPGVNSTFTVLREKINTYNVRTNEEPVLKIHTVYGFWQNCME